MTCECFMVCWGLLWYSFNNWVWHFLFPFFSFVCILLVLLFPLYKYPTSFCLKQWKSYSKFQVSYVISFCFTLLPSRMSESVSKVEYCVNPLSEESAQGWNNLLKYGWKMFFFHFILTQKFLWTRYNLLPVFLLHSCWYSLSVLAVRKGEKMSSTIYG